MQYFKIIVWLASLMTLCAPRAAMALEPERPGQEDFLKRVVFVERHLWMLSDAGELSSVNDRADKRTRERTPEPFTDICEQDRQLLAVSSSDTLTLWRRTAESWSVVVKLAREQEVLVSLNCGPNGVSFLTTRRLVELGDGRERTVVLADKLPKGLITATLDDESGFFVGINMGEWGGGLWRIDRQSGRITRVERNTTGELCAGPLNTACDPVNGIVSDPWKPGCILAAVGLVHFSPHGRLVEVCGDTIDRFYVKAYGTQPPNPQNIKSDEPFSSVAFFGLIRQGNIIWAAGIDGLYKFDDPHTPCVLPLPSFKDVGGINVSFDLPGIVLALTEINRRASLSGATPLMVAR
jgi:hypothetical protein